MGIQKKPLPPLARLKELFDVTSDGRLRRRVTVNNFTGGRAGEFAGRQKPNQFGYYTVAIDGDSYQVHRIVWALTHGRDPGQMEVDHRDRNRANNSPDNLRLLDHVRQQWNTGVWEHNTSGMKGVNFNKRQKKWGAYIIHFRRHIWLGTHDTRHEAALFRAAAEHLLRTA